MIQGSASVKHAGGSLTVTELTLPLHIRLTGIHEHFNGIVSLVPLKVFSQGLHSKNPPIDAPFLCARAAFAQALKPGTSSLTKSLSSSQC